MTYYNETLYDNATNLFTYFDVTNTISNGIFYNLNILAGTFLIIFIVLKLAEQEANISLLASSFATLFISLLLWSLGGLGDHIVIICAIMTLGSIIFYNVTKE